MPEDIEITPDDVSELTDAVELAVGAWHSCARRGLGQVACWGMNVYGEIGGEFRTDCPGYARPEDYAVVPVLVADLTDAVEIAAGGWHSCARRASGAIVCWGNDEYGQIGDGTIARRRPTPVPVEGVTDAIAISAGSWHTCAVRSSGEVVCWGADHGGQLGDGDAPHEVCEGEIEGRHACSRALVTVPGVDDAVQLAAGYRHTCALRASGRVSCWGSGPLGDGMVSDHSPPVEVSGLDDAIQVTAGGRYAGDTHTCALRASGEVVCWGTNRFGELGDGTTTDRLVPTPVIGL